MNEQRFNEIFNNLTKRRQDVLKKFLAGEDDPTIAKSFNIEDSTVRKHIQQICNAFNLKNEHGERYPKRPELKELFRKYRPDLVKNSSLSVTNEGDIQKTLEREGHCDPSSLQGVAEIGTTKILDKNPSLYQDLKNAPTVPYLYGRTQELEALKKSILQDKCNLILLLGRGGIGKTSLSVRLITEIPNNFDYIIWRSLEASPTVENILEDSIKLFSNQQETILPETLDEKITRLISYFASSRCLLILDNGESILQSGNQTGKYRENSQG
ncbi:MAG: hypothetical protein F6K39_14190 [Okeania sp. SIO3B3]|nr:hypothetical protein [Okeania sp. SIO3B3]